MEAPSPWTDWPARRMPGRAAFAAAVALGTTTAVATVDLPLAFIGLALFAASTAEILLPTTYTLDADGVTASNALGRRRILWSQLRGWAPTADGVALLGAGRVGITRRRRSLVLRGPASKAALVTWLSAVVPQERATA